MSRSSTARAVVISNCQSLPLKHALTLLCKNLSFDHLGVHALGPDRDGEIADFVDVARRDYDHVVSVGLSNDFGPLASDKIGETFSDQVLTKIATIYHAGLHPDLMYIGGMANRLAGPLNDYHSRIALIGYLRRMSEPDILKLYNAGVYEKLDYLDAMSRSTAELVSREAVLDVAVSPLITEMYREVSILMSVNHPTAALIWAFAVRIAAYMAENHGVELSGWCGGAALLANELAFSDIYPIFPEIAEHLGLKYAGSLLFKPQGHGNQPVQPLSLEQFVSREMAAFASIDRAVLEASHQGVQILEWYKDLDLTN